MFPFMCCPVRLLSKHLVNFCQKLLSNNVRFCYNAFMDMKNEIVIYRPNELAEHIEVRFEDDTVWLSQLQMAALFNHTQQNISLHINNCYRENELDRNSTVKESLLVRKEGNRTVRRKIEHYNLDVIISVGYRVKSQQGTQFRIWATDKLKDYLLKGYVMNTRMDRIEKRVDEIDLQIKTNRIPTQGVFFDGQVFDAYELTSRIIRSAKQSIVLIDNYTDESTLTQLSKKGKGVKALVLTRDITNQLTLDIKKANAQYGDFDVKQFTESHDRFLIIDNGTEVYHLGASLKDLGKKLFAFSKMEKESVDNIIKTISTLI